LNPQEERILKPLRMVNSWKW